MINKLEDYEWICPEPFTNLKTNPDGHMVPCCVTNLEKYGKDFQNMNLSHTANNTIQEYHNSEYIKLFKKSFSRFALINAFEKFTNCLLDPSPHPEIP